MQSLYDIVPNEECVYLSFDESEELFRESFTDDDAKTVVDSGLVILDPKFIDSIIETEDEKIAENLYEIVGENGQRYGEALTNRVVAYLVLKWGFTT